MQDVFGERQVSCDLPSARPELLLRKCGAASHLRQTAKDGEASQSIYVKKKGRKEAEHTDMKP